MAETKEQTSQRLQAKFDSYRNALLESTKPIELAILAIAEDVKCDKEETERIKFAFSSFIDVFMYKIALKIEANEKGNVGEVKMTTE